MYYIISTHNVPRFYNHTSSTPIVIEEIEYTYEKVIDGITVSSSEPMCANPKDAISTLMANGIMGYRTKKQARETVKALELKTCKYLLIE